MIELRHEHFNQLFHDLLEDFLVVLLCNIRVEARRLLHDAGAFFTKLLDDRSVTPRSELFNLCFDGCCSFILQLITSVVSHHVSLVWQVELFLLADDLPRLVDVDWHTVEGHV